GKGLKFAMGGSIGGTFPGSVGFTYARTGGIPSNGPYAKKTLPSAQNGKKQGNPVFDWWYNLDDVQGTYKMYNDLDPFLKNWYKNPETQRRLKQNLQDSLLHRNTNPSQLTSQAINTLQNTPAFSRELVKKAGISSSDLEYNNELQGWKSPSTVGGNPYFDSHNYMTGISELGSYDPDTKQIIVNSFNLPGTIAHEGVHGAPVLQDAMEDVIDWKYLNKKDPKARFSEQFGTLNWDANGNDVREPFEKVKNRFPGIYSSWEKQQEYLDRDGMYPRIMDIRRTLNLKPGQKVDKSILENESISHPLDDLKHYYDEDTIIDMLNTLAKNDNKKTMPSAQNGDKLYPIDLHLPIYEKPKPSLNPYAFYVHPKQDVHVAGIGAHAQGDINDRLNLSGGLHSTSVSYPGGKKMFMKPEYHVGMKYRFDNGGSMSYYQHGLDWKPKSISKNGSDIPKNQNAQYTLPRFDMPRAASESTSRVFNDPITGKQISTATTGQKKEDVKAATEAMRKGRETERKIKEAKKAERKSARDFNEGKTKTFTLPTGESKTLDQMDAREKMYVAGKSLEGKGSIGNEDSFFNEYLNPVTMVTNMAGSLGESPYEAKQSNSNMPYVSAIASPLLMGRMMGSGSINPFGKKFWTNEVSN
ncbi:MAG: hypothetical protein EB127_22180, partial [Alphaproteobacteria bacterium]|nr:hypothetical protein [Alphaproteobacteria bacterium]